MTSQTKRRFRLILIGLFCSYLIFVFARMFSSEHLEFSTTYVPKYSHLFFNQKVNYVSLSGTYLGKNRNPISNYDIDKKYDLVVYQIDLANDKPLRKLISVENEESSLDGNAVYSTINEALFEISVKDNRASSAEKIIMKYQGERFEQIATNDTIAYYDLRFKHLSFQNKKENEVDLFLETKDPGLSTDLTPLSILFLKRQKALYLFLLCPKSKGMAIERKMLYNLVQSDQR